MNSFENLIINKIEEIVKNKFQNESSGHDWWHIYRVWQTSIRMAEIEKANMFIVQTAALLHDIADWKFHDGNQDIGPQKAEEILNNLAVEPEIVNIVKNIVKNISFKGAKVEHAKMETLEGMIVQDADRLDAIGALGIARAFACGAHKNQVIYDPEIKPIFHDDANIYVKSSNPTINHFYEKLLLLKDRMNTQIGKKLAQERHDFMESYLAQFYREWNQEI